MPLCFLGLIGSPRGAVQHAVIPIYLFFRRDSVGERFSGIKMNKDQASSLVWLTFALFICAETLRRLSLGSWGDPGPGFLPALSGGVLGVLALIHFLHSYLRKSGESRGLWILPERWKALLFVIISLFVYVFLLEPLGFVTATFLLLIILFRAAEPHPWMVVIGGSALTSFITYLLFDVFLKCQLPKGILGF